MKAIIKWTLWQRRLSTFWWSIAVFGLIFINMVFYPTFKDQAAELQKGFENLPDAAVQLFGGSTDFFSPVGFLNSQIYFFMLPMLLSILAIGLGSSLLAREEQDKTIENLLSRPVSRTSLLFGKSIAGLVILTIVALVGLFTTLITAKIVDLDVPVSNILAASLSCYLLCLTFGAIALVLTAIGKTRGSSLGITAFVAIGGYLISSLSGTVSWLKGPSKVFPFDYYKSENILRGSYEWNNLIFFLAIIGISGILTWFFFGRRDIS